MPKSSAGTPGRRPTALLHRGSTRPRRRRLPQQTVRRGRAAGAGQSAAAAGDARPQSGGEWISSLQIEDILSQLPGVAEAAVIGVPDDKWGERPLAVVVPQPSPAGPTDGNSIKALITRYAEKGVIS